MRNIQLFFLTGGLPIMAIILHELTHLVVARSISSISVSLTSWIPFRLQLDFHDNPSKYKMRVVALAPILVGSLIAVIFVRTGSWRQIQQINPYYVYYLVGLNWLLYVFPSPADLRLAFQPPTRELSDEGTI